MSIRTVGSALLVLSISGAAASAQAPPLGPEFQVNSLFTYGAQTQPSIASAGDGSFVVVWEDPSQDGNGYGIFGQRFDALGAKVGSEFLVDTFTTNDQKYPAVAVGKSGEFVIVWQSFGQDGSEEGVFGQRFGLDAFGATTIGPEFQVNTHTTDDQQLPAVAVAESGDFVVVWQSGTGGSNVHLFGQRFDASGDKVGSEFPVSSETTAGQFRPRIAMDPVGNFVVVWDGYDAVGGGVFGQRFDAAGQKIGAEFQVNTYTTALQYGGSVVMSPRGDFLVVWASHGQDGSGFGVFGQRFDASGGKVGLEFPVNSYTTNDQIEPRAAMDQDGGFVVVWSSYGQDGSNNGIFGQRLDRLGNKLGAEFPINTYTTDRQARSSLASDGVGFVAVWESDDQSEAGIFGRRQSFHPERLHVDEHGIATSDLNGVLEPGEAAVVGPAWTNVGSTNYGDVTGTVTLTGPGAADYELLDGFLDYGSMFAGTTRDCNAASCYAVQIGGPRPTVHWDALLQETLSVGGSQAWTLHLGDSFTDVPRQQPFYRRIETMLHYGITLGCAEALYCPNDPVPRDQMAIFIAKAIAGAGELVPERGILAGQPYDCSAGGTSLFADVSPATSFCRHAHYLATQNVTVGCGPGLYCPAQTVTRDAMAAFIAKGIMAPRGGGAVPSTYGPDPVTGRSYSCDAGSPNVHFTDVAPSNAFCRHIHFLWAKGVVDGCSATQYCPALPVNRDAMAKFIANGFGLRLYGP